MHANAFKAKHSFMHPYDAETVLQHSVWQLSKSPCYNTIVGRQPPQCVSVCVYVCVRDSSAYVCVCVCDSSAYVCMCMRVS